MAILAVLAALAIPAFGSMRSKADAARCSSNLRQMIMATQSWANENNGKFPALINHPWDEKGHIADLSTFPLSSPPVIPFGIALAPFLGFEPIDTSQGLDPARIPAVLRCPAASRNRTQRENFSWASAWPSYRYNSYAASRIPAAALNLSKAMLFIDAVWPGWSDDSFSHQSPAGINVGYADGHVAFLPAPRYRELNPTTDYQGTLYRNGWFLDL
jgi:prepilin-type processing-associated H-X9-DG protein